jgi:methyl-accepting chemotaxis protein
MRQSNQRTQTTLEMACPALPVVALEQITQSIHQINANATWLSPALRKSRRRSPREVDRNLVNIRDLATQSAAGANQTSAATRRTVATGGGFERDGGAVS